MNLTRTVLFLVAALMLSTTANAGDEAWRIVQSTGVVKAGGSGFMPAAVRPDQSLPRDSWVETGDTGRVVLVRGAETIALGPNARVQLPSQEVNGNTQVLQTLGSALYQIGKQKKPHFQVDTPYLAAVVKGTTFTVSVGEEASSVDVTEGLVQVASANGADTEYVSPGFTGIVSKNDTGNVVVVTTPNAPAAAPDAAPTKSSDKSASNGSEGNNRSVIAAAIGETVVDVKDVSGGLASGLETAVSNGVGLVSISTDASDDSGKSNNASNGNATASSVATVDVAGTSLSAEVGSSSANGVGNVGASVDLGATTGGGVAAGVDLGNSNGNGSGAGVSVDLGVGGSNGNGGLDLSVGNGGTGNGSGNGNAGGLGLGLGNGNAGGKGKSP